MPDCEELEEDKFLNRFVTNYFTLKFNAVILIDSKFVHPLWATETLEFILDHSLISLYGETFNYDHSMFAYCLKEQTKAFESIIWD